MKSASRSDRANARITESSAAVWLHWYQFEKKVEFREDQIAKCQFILAAELKPTRFRRKWQKKLYDGPNARRDRVRRTIEVAGDLGGHPHAHDHTYGPSTAREPWEHVVVRRRKAC